LETDVYFRDLMSINIEATMINSATVYVECIYLKTSERCCIQAKLEPTRVDPLKGLKSHLWPWGRINSTSFLPKNYEWAQKARAFVPGKPYQASVL
jgi:hypothetical protein